MPAAERPGTPAVTTPRPPEDTGKPVSIAPSPTAKVEPPPPKPTPPGPAPLPKPPLPPAALGGPVMAYVNDMPVYMSELDRLLVAAFGLGVAQQLIANRLVDEEGRKQGLSVTDAEAQAEHERTLTEMFGDVKDANQRQRLLQQLLARNRVSEEQWDLTMHRNALLAKLAAKRVVVTEEDLQDEFGRTYERKVEVMHIQVASLSDAQKVLRELASGAEFGALVAKYSIGPSGKEGGLLAPFGAKDAGTPPALREAGMALKKIGEVSDPIQIGTAFHLVKLLRIIEPKDVKFEDVKAALTETVRKRKTALLQQDILQILIRGARILYVNPTLKAQVEKGS
jgi:foldase protein PrsA